MADNDLSGTSNQTQGNAASTKTPQKTVADTGIAKETAPVTNTATSTTPISTTPGLTGSTSSTTTTADVASQAGKSPHREEAKSRFSAALDEAKAGAAALKAEAGERANSYRSQAKGKGEDLKGQARLKGDDAKLKGRELAAEGRGQASRGLRAVGEKVNGNGYRVDETLGAKYGDYARSASSSLSGYADTLDQKSVDELTEDAREFVRRSPGLAVGMAAVAGYMISSLFRR